MTSDFRLADVALDDTLESMASELKSSSNQLPFNFRNGFHVDASTRKRMAYAGSG